MPQSLLGAGSLQAGSGEWPQLSGDERQASGKNTLILNKPTPTHPGPSSSAKHWTHGTYGGLSLGLGKPSANHGAHTQSKLLLHHQWGGDFASAPIASDHKHSLPSHREFYNVPILWMKRLRHQEVQDPESSSCWPTTVSQPLETPGENEAGKPIAVGVTRTWGT